MGKPVFNLQWHVTEKCNRSCIHCYQDGKSSKELTWDEILNVHQQYLSFLDEKFGDKSRGRITLTGGEPFIRQDFLPLLQYLHRNKSRTPFCVLTNGSMIDKTLAKQIAKYEPLFVQISLEGNEVTHDYIRGQGDFKSACNSIKILHKQGINVQVSFTASSLNFREFPDAVKAARDNGANVIWTDRYIPEGKDSVAPLTKEETKEYLELIAQTALIENRRYRKIKISLRRALQFLCAGATPYSCPAGDTLLTIKNDGTVVPCRRMDIPMGNILNNSLSDIYSKAAHKNKTPDACQGCDFEKSCKGGLRCLSYSTYGNTNNPDPGCWLAD